MIKVLHGLREKVMTGFLGICVHPPIHRAKQLLKEVEGGEKKKVRVDLSRGRRHGGRGGRERPKLRPWPLFNPRPTDSVLPLVEWTKYFQDHSKISLSSLKDDSRIMLG